MREREPVFSGEGEKEVESRPKFYLIDQEGEVYIPMKDASKLSGLKHGTLRALTCNERVRAVQPGGRDLFISRGSLQDYLERGRKKAGRPRKTQESSSILSKRRTDGEKHPLENSGFPYFQDPEGQFWLPMESASEFSGLSNGYLRTLICDERIEARQPGGRDLFVSYDSLDHHLKHGRKPMGRPRKSDGS